MLEGVTGEELLTYAVIYLILCGVVALVARSQGKSPAGAFGFSLLFSPILGFLFAVLGGSEDERKCPHCAENIKLDATVCRYCGKDVPPYAGPKKYGLWS